MNKTDLEEAVRLAAATEREAAADYRHEIAEHDAGESSTADPLSPRGREWVIAYDALKSARDILDREFGPEHRRAS
ncbi:hypothetical protein [Paenarthrobacter sp. PH39-S1]|uniref:hypothetical protein n=1 Tax=Paenarthrobacter sp. PH39-S1 TaxID=3046204 RepID=UPI0024BBC6D4|nr:hypothetical protein [Paenarthrobacter sp. PH39-S1]MDJ0355524.1 hypothetical protein [Paenarthrobacter sp. PH39-S1]